jgi:D-alanyl-D-alanine carboxypeptidase (penicillin-binding protein 5/6)
MKERKYPIMLLVGILICVGIFSFMSIAQARREKINYLEEVAFKSREKVNIFSGVPLEAESAYVYDMTDHEVLFERDADIPRGIASISKLMTLAVVYPEVKDTVDITVSKRSVDTEGFSPLTPGSTWRTEDLIALMLVGSSNDAAEALAEEVETRLGGEKQFLGAMNERAKKLGMQKTLFRNVTGLDIETSVSNISTAYDITLLAEYLLENIPEITETVARKNFTLIHNALMVENTNTIIDKIPNILLSKTGYTDYAGGTLVVAYRSPKNNHIVISTVLGSSLEGRFHDTLTIVDRVETYFNELTQNGYDGQTQKNN